MERSYFSAKSFSLMFRKFAFSLFRFRRKSLGDEHFLKRTLSFKTMSLAFYLLGAFKLFAFSLNMLDIS